MNFEKVFAEAKMVKPRRNLSVEEMEKLNEEDMLEPELRSNFIRKIRRIERSGKMINMDSIEELRRRCEKD